MVQRGIKGVRAAWLDATAELARSLDVADPPPDQERGGLLPGRWPGSPADCLPPKCPVIPLGVDGKLAYFVDTLGQLIPVASSEWSKKMLTQLFALQPNYLYWAWPRWNSKTLTINGLDVDDAHQCLIKSAAQRGLFSPIDRVRGRGAWVTRTGELIWHAGDALYRVEGKRLRIARAGEVDGIFYPQRPPVTKPWMEPVDPSDSPVPQLLADLGSWTWERPQLDPLLVLGWIGCAFLGAALPWRPHLFATGDKGVGKSTLQGVIKAIIGDALHACADTTAAGIYQRVKQDSLPVAIDELEATADNRRVMAVVSLARLAASGNLMYRGGAEHEGVEFRLQNAFFFSSINPPPLEPQDRSRMAIVNMGRLDPAKLRRAPEIDADVVGRMILRALMDAWPAFDRTLAAWRDALRLGGLDARGQDTYGTLLAVANLLLGDEAMEAAGMPVTEAERLGAVVASATQTDRSEGLDNWRGCLERLLDSQIDAWTSGSKPTIGKVIEDWESGELPLSYVNERLLLVGLRAKEEIGAAGKPRRLLCVPLSSAALAKIFAGTKWSGEVWGTALKQAEGSVVIRDRGNGQNVKINRKTVRCLFVDLAGYDRVVEGEDR
jgi:hypothetical protein